MMIVESAGMTDIGRSRSKNEDALFRDDDLRLYLVADGLGGHQAGEVASRLVVETIRDCMLEYQRGGPIDTLEGYDNTLSDEANRLRSGIFRANREVNRLASQESYRHMASTVSAAYFADDGLITANVGDSPIWLVQNERIETLSVPHTVLAEEATQRPAERTKLAPEFQHMLTRAMGIESKVQPDICEMPCFPGDTVVMASDGLSGKVSVEEVLDLVSREPPAQACRSLVDLANARGGDDNITVIVVKVLAIRPRARSIMTRFQEWFKR
jgi:PPM family protein phosphatase